MLRLFRKRPIIVQAVLTSDVIEAIFVGPGWEALPDWLKRAYDVDDLIIGNHHVDV